MTSTVTIPLETFSNNPSDHNFGQSENGIDISPAISHPTDVEQVPLPPTDHGKQAYLVLLGCTMIQAPIWGYSLAFGVFQEYYTSSTSSPIQHASSGSIATVGTTLNGIMYLMMPVVFTVLTKYPHLRPYTGPVGLVITTGSLIISSFATKVWQLIASQGVLCAIGSGMLFAPTTLYMDEWFISRKGMAYGVLWAGKSAGGVVFPFLMTSLLSKYGARTTLISWSVALFIICSPLLFFLKPRIPISRNTEARPLDWRFLKYTTFWMLQIGNIIQSLGYLLPNTYLASYAHSLGLSNITGAVLIAMNSMASVPGGVVIGYLGDKFSPPAVIMFTSFMSMLAVLLFWGLSSTLPVLMLFSIFYGFFAGGFSSTYAGVLRELTREVRVETGLVMGLLLGGRGLGFVVGGPVSAGLLGISKWSGAGDWGYGTEYGGVIVATGITAVFGGWGWMWKTMKGLSV